MIRGMQVSDRLCRFFREALKPAPPPTEERMKPTLFALQRRGITNYRTLLKSIDGLPISQLRTALEVLGLIGRKEAVPKLLSLLKTKRTCLWEIRSALTAIGGERAFIGLKQILTDKKQIPERRFEACHALAHQFYKVDPSVFFSVVIDKTNGELLRGQAVEGIAIHAPYYNRRRHNRISTQVLLDCLRDSCAEVRFWGVFGMACLKVEESLPKLRKLARDDHAVASLGWSVAEEAKDVIYCLTKGRWPEIDASERRSRALSTRSKEL